jgi:methylmalonyl-CoA mutase
MSKVSIPFSAVSQPVWQDQLQKELKEKTELLQYQSEVEGIQLSLANLEQPRLAQQETESINWQRMVAVHASTAKQSNALLLEALMQGADAIFIDQTSTDTDYQTLLQAIEIEYISCLICFDNPAAIDHFIDTIGMEKASKCIILKRFGPNQNFISTFGIQQIGANSTTELAKGLLDLQQLLETNPQSMTIYIESGIGGEYLLEISKFRALKHLVRQLALIHKVEIDLKIIAKTGFCNKSLIDPYTNLLRLSTESLSAIMGGVHLLCVQAYDMLSTEGPSSFAQRMALNVANLISEEAHLGTTQDLLYNAYAIEQLTFKIAEKTWQLLCSLDTAQSGAQEILLEQISETRKVRTHLFNSSNHILIGINAFANEFESPTAQWGELPQVFGLPYLIFEKIAN